MPLAPCVWEHHSSVPLILSLPSWTVAQTLTNPHAAGFGVELSVYCDESSWASFINSTYSRKQGVQPGLAFINTDVSGRSAQKKSKNNNEINPKVVIRNRQPKIPYINKKYNKILKKNNPS